MPRSQRDLSPARNRPTQEELRERANASLKAQRKAEKRRNVAPAGIWAPVVLIPHHHDAEDMYGSDDEVAAFLERPRSPSPGR